MRRRIDVVRRPLGRRKLVVLAAAPLAALALAGCGGFSPVSSASQGAVVGQPTMHTEICLADYRTGGSPAQPHCRRPQDASLDQMLVAYLVPEPGMASPTPTSADAIHTTVEQFPNYTAWVNQWTN